MENYKKQITDRGYKVVSETEEGISFVNEDVKFCAILLKKYKEDGNDKEYGRELKKTLNYSYAEKGTFCIIISTDDDRDKIQRDPYFYVKIFTDKINILPIKEDKSITIIFMPMKDSSDVGDYTVNAFDHFDGLLSASYFEYLTNAKHGDIVKYPKIIDSSFFRYHANKLYTIENIK